MKHYIDKYKKKYINFAFKTFFFKSFIIKADFTVYFE